MKHYLLAVAQVRNGVEKDLFDVYQKRLSRPLYVIELKQHNCPQKEAVDILKHISLDDWVCVLDESGVSISSRDLSKEIEKAEQKFKRLVYVIGGADGLTQEIRERSNLCLSLGKLTWPHLLVRGLLAEQLYRCEKIASGHPYHRD